MNRFPCNNFYFQSIAAGYVKNFLNICTCVWKTWLFTDVLTISAELQIDDYFKM